MGYVPPPLPPWVLTLDQQIAPLERDLKHRSSRLWWRRRRAYAACIRLIVLREHLLWGEHRVLHAGGCPVGDCQPKPPAPPRALRPAAPTYSLR